jgi:purine-binding chemotaxis protein CheW
MAFGDRGLRPLDPHRRAAGVAGRWAVNALAGNTGRSALQVLTLALHGETFALDALQVREILDPVPVTEVPGAPRALGGLINVRGKVVPLLDLCLKLGMPPSPTTIDTRFIVVDVPVGGSPTIVGVRADRVYDMTELAAEAQEDAPKIGTRVRSSFVRCIGKRAREFLIVLDLEAILRSEPRTADFTNRRRHRRLKVTMPCRIDIDASSTTARIGDLSEGGASVAGFAARPQADCGDIAIDGVPHALGFRVVDFQGGMLRLKFDPGNDAALSALVRRLEQELGNAA